MLLSSGLVSGCGATTGDVAAPTPTTVVSAAPMPQSPAPVESASAATTPAGRRFVVDARPNPEDIDDDTGPAPCDFLRSYRGTIGKTPVTLLLRPAKDGTLEGLGHYDVSGPAIPLDVTLTGTSFRIAETKGGTFEGACDATGALRGTFKLGKRTEAFLLKPRPAAWPAFHRVERRATAEPNHPICKTRGKADEANEIELPDGEHVICLPRNPARRKAFLADAQQLLCSADDRGLRVFGLADARIEKSVNAILTNGGYDLAAHEIRRCTGTRTEDFATTLVVARKDLIVVSSFTSSFFGGAHPSNSGGHTTVIDLPTGKSVTLDEIVDKARLRAVAIACLPFHAIAASSERELTLPESLPEAGCGNELDVSMGRFLWGCDKDDRAAPEVNVLPEGVVIGAWGNPHVAAALDGQGPIVPWSVLLRENVLRAGSPLARLWAAEAPAAASVPACTGSYEGARIRMWREVK